MRYRCEFEHRDTGARKTVIAALSAAEVACVQALSKDAELISMAMILRTAYREVTHGFLHTEPPKLIQPS